MIIVEDEEMHHRPEAQAGNRAIFNPTSPLPLSKFAANLERGQNRCFPLPFPIFARKWGRGRGLRFFAFAPFASFAVNLLSGPSSANLCSGVYLFSPGNPYNTRKNHLYTFLTSVNKRCHLKK